MNVAKRASYTLPKTHNTPTRYNGKLKEILSTSSASSMSSFPSPSSSSTSSISTTSSVSSSSSQEKAEVKINESDLTNIPLIKQADNVKILPKYTAILSKTGDDGVSMEDLDQLQLDLEKLLSTCAVRIRFLLSEIGEVTKTDDTGRKTMSLKRKRPDEKPKLKDFKNGLPVVKKHYGLPVNKILGDTHAHQEMPKVTLPKNDDSDKFWASIEPFCANVTKEDVSFLDNLLEEFSKEIDIKIPDLGEHYAQNWTEEIINEEQNLGKSLKKNINGDKKNGLHVVMESLSNVQPQKQTPTIEDRILNALPKNSENRMKVKPTKTADYSKLKPSIANAKIEPCIDKRLKKVLVDQGFISEDLNKNMPDDEILEEIKKCLHELATVNEYNIEETNQLKRLIANDLRLIHLKESLEKVDQKILDLYNKIMIAKKTSQQEDTVIPDEVMKEYETQTDALLKQQNELNREISGLTDTRMIL